nr:hypothetical protein [Tanacetum cinerariifolium]
MKICNKKNQVLFTDTECLVLSKDFKLPDESMVVLRIPRKYNLYTINLKNLCPKGNLACLVAHASVDEFVKWHRRMGYVNYKNMNRLAKGKLIRGLPPKLFKNDHTCVACCKGKQHKASYKAINAVSSISEPLQLLHMDLFGPTSIRSIDHKYYCFVITNDYSRFCWVFFLERKDVTYPILKDFINLVENQLNKKIKAIRCDNGTEFKNAHMIELCGSKGINREYSNARTPQQNRVTERKNRTLIEAARTMLADYKLPTIFWTEAVRTACYVFNRVSVTRPHNKSPYALLTGNIPSVSHFKPFGCHVTILNTSDHLGMFDRKADEGYIVGYSVNTLGYKHVQANQSARAQGVVTNPAGTQGADSDCDCDDQVIIVPSYPSHSIPRSEPKDTSGDEVDDSPLHSADEIFQKELARLKVPFGNVPVPPGSLPVPTGSISVPTGNTLVSTDDVPVHTSSLTNSFFDDEPTTRFHSPLDLRNHDPSHGIFSSSSYDDEFGAALNNVASIVEVSPVAAMRINTIHPQSMIIGDPTSAVQTRSKVKQTTTGDSTFISYTDLQHCLFACFLSQVEPRSVAQALEDPSWVDAIQEEMGLLFRNKARLVAQGHRQVYGIDYDEVFAPVARIEAIRLFLAFASYMGFMVYQMDVKSAFLNGRINKEVYVTQPKGFVDPQHPNKVYKAWCDEFEALMKGEFQMSVIGELAFFLGLQVQQRPDGIFINPDKYVQEILNKFDLGSVRTAITPYEATKPKSKNEYDSPVNVHLYRSMIGSLMYLTASRPDIMFAVSACSRNQVTPTTSNLEAVKKIFKYLKGQPKLGLWYPKESPLILEAYSDSDYVGANKDRKSTTGGSEYVAAANCCGQVLWIQNQLLDYGLMVQDGGLVLFKCFTWTMWPYSDEKVFILVVQEFPLVLPEFLMVVSFRSYWLTTSYWICYFSFWLTFLCVGFDLKQFRSTAMLRSPELGPLAIQATIDMTPYIITKDLVTSRLQLADDGGEGAEVAAQAVPQHMPAPDQPQDHLSTPPRKQTSDPHAQVLEHGQCSDPNTVSFSQSHKTAAGPFTNVKDEPLGGSFNMSLPGSTQAPPAGDAEDPITLTVLSFVVSILVQKVKSLETELKDHKKLFKDVVGKLVKKVKVMEVKLKTKKRKMVVSDSDQEEGRKQDVDLDALRALANAVETVDSNISPGGASNNPATSTSVPFVVPIGATAVPPGASTIPPGASTIPADSPSVPADVSPSVAPAGVSNKGKSLMVEKTFLSKQGHLSRWKRIDLGQALAEKLAQERQNRPMTQAQQRAYMRQYVKNQSSVVYTIGWTMAYVKFFTDDQLKKEFEKICKVQSNSQLQAFSRTLKRTGPVLEEPSSKRQRSTETPIPSVPEVPQSLAVSSPPSSGTKKKSLGRKRLTKPKSTLQELDLDVDAQTFIKVVSTEDSDDEAPPVWSALIGWEVFYMFSDVSYPLSVKLMQRMLTHKLEIDSDVVGNDMTTAEQLIHFIKNQLVAAQVSSV